MLISQKLEFPSASMQTLLLDLEQWMYALCPLVSGPIGTQSSIVGYHIWLDLETDLLEQTHCCCSQTHLRACSKGNIVREHIWGYGLCTHFKQPAECRMPMPPLCSCTGHYVECNRIQFQLRFLHILK